MTDEAGSNTSTLTGAAKAVGMGQPIEWLKQGWAYFMKNPGIWIGLSVALLAITIILSFVPFIGQLCLNLAMPALMAGLLIGCRSLQQGKELTFEHLFAGFKQNANGLLMVGVWYTIGAVAIMMIGGFLMFLVGGSALAAVLFTGNHEATAGLGIFAILMMLAVALFMLALFLPLFMAMWFAPPLVTFGNMEPLAAMKASFAGSLKNILPFLVYGVILLVLGFVATIPAFLGWLILMPVLYGAHYAAYQDIFE
ncbi:MAG: hypothetical protein LBP94_03555 [Zoogloeaceae bacterium]|jgi:uncharacterized membrane protein|nr:hypothetical protein [Zoogloeaceae bacterium]